MKNSKRADNLPKTLLRLVSYFKKHAFWFALALITASLTGVCNILGTYYGGFVTDHLLEYAQALSTSTDTALLSSQYSVIFRNDIILIICLYASGVFCAIFHNEIMVNLTQKVLFQIRSELTEKMQSLPISYFDTHPHGEIMSLFTNDVDSILQALNDALANIVLSFTNMIGTIVCLFVINVPLSLIVVFFIIIMFVFMFINARISRKYYIQQQQALADVNAVVEEDISGVRVIKAFSHEKESFDKFLKYNENWRNASQNAFYHTQVNTPFFVSLSYLNFSISSVCGVLALCTGWAGYITFGGLQSYLVLTRNACQPFNYFTQHLNSILVASAGAERVFRFLDEKSETNEGTIKLELISPETDDFTKRYAWKRENGELIPLQGIIRFNNVHFSYIKGKEILKGISFEVHPGKKIAFVGSTGAGKTTIISLLARFYPIDSGEISYDGINIEDIELDSLRRAISMVTQDTHLFTDTILDNIRYVRRHSTEEEVVMASKNSHADSFIKRSPEGYDTMLYDDGANLSEGQRQLLGITRASLNRSPVMILDEATSNIDTRSELLIQQGLNQMMKGRSVIVIAHRLSTIRDADEILVLDHGVITERGSQEVLLSLKGDYYNLYTGKTELS